MNFSRNSVPRPAMSTAVLLFAVALASAQEPDRFDAHCANILVLQNKGVQKALGITKPQLDRMRMFSDHHDAELAALDKRTKGTKTNVDPELLKYFAELKDAVVGVLSPAQLKRLREITMQEAGLLALCDPIVGKRAGLSAPQIAKLRSTYDEGLKKYTAVEREAQERVLAPYKDKKPKTKEEVDALNKEVGAKLSAEKKRIAPQLKVIRDDYDKRMRAILTSTQLATYNSLRGAPLKL